MFLILAHLVNLVVVTVLPILMLSGNSFMDPVYGPDSPARRILACIYGAIAAASGFALLSALLGDASTMRQVAWVLFPMQIGYKIATAFTVGLRNPVVLSNLAICVVLGLALAT